MDNKDLIPLVIGLPTLAISGINLWFTFKNRSSVHRDFFYKKQVEEYDKFVDALSAFDKSFFLSIASETNHNDKADKYNNAHKELSKLLNRFFLYGSLSSYEPVMKYTILFSMITDKVWEGSEDISDECESLHGYLLDIISSIKLSLGFGELSKEIMNATGVHIKEIEKKIKP